jgi:hypothetical protein
MHPDDVHAVTDFISFHLFFKYVCPISFRCFFHRPSLPHMEETSNTSTEEAQSNRISSGNPVNAAYLPLKQTGWKFTVRGICE